MGQTNFLQALGWAVLNSLWQMAFLWVIYQLATGFIKKRAAQKSLLAVIFLLTGFSWFLYTFFSILSSHSSDMIIISSGLVSAGGNEKLNNWLHNTLPVASLIYLSLLALPVLHFIKNYRYVQLIRHYGLSKINVQWRIFVQKLSAQMGINKPVHIWMSELVSSPVTIGYLKPLILIPLAAINHLTPQQLEAVILHELSHIRRYDYLINLVINFIQTILYFNPFVKAFVKTVEREREKSCDEMVIQFQYDPHDYATALLILERSNHLYKPLAIAAAGKKNDLLHRVELILGVHKKPVVSFNKLAGLFAGFLCIIAINALLILSKPVNGNHSMAFSGIHSPFYFVPFDNSAGTDAVTNEKKSSAVQNHLRQNVSKNKPVTHPSTPAENAVPGVADPFFVNVNYEPVEAQTLKNYQEEQVKQVIETSKKILENAQWKSVEKNIADVLTQKVKDQLHTEYQKELDKFDWKKWEDKLRLAYNNVDWEKINDQLGKAVDRIRLDSLQIVYNNAAAGLALVQQQLSENNLNGIPDTDITLKEVEQKKLEILKTLNNLKALRTKKIIHL